MNPTAPIGSCTVTSKHRVRHCEWLPVWPIVRALPPSPLPIASGVLTTMIGTGLWILDPMPPSFHARTCKKCGYASIRMPGRAPLSHMLVVAGCSHEPRQKCLSMRSRRLRPAMHRLQMPPCARYAVVWCTLVPRRMRPHNEYCAQTRMLEAKRRQLKKEAEAAARAEVSRADLEKEIARESLTNPALAAGGRCWLAIFAAACACSHAVTRGSTSQRN